MTLPYDRLRTMGSTWSSPTGVGGIGGPDKSVNVGEFHADEHMQGMCTLYLGFRNIGPILPGVPSGILYADVTVGFGVASFTFRMDWANGESISVPAGTVKVDAVQLGGVMISGVALSAALAVSPRGITTAPTFTQHISIGAGASEHVILPFRARGLLVPRVNGAASDVIVNVLTRAAALSGGTYSQAVAADSALWTTGIVLPGTAGVIELTSVAGVAGNRQPVVFLLDG